MTQQGYITRKKILNRSLNGDDLLGEVLRETLSIEMAEVMHRETTAYELNNRKERLVN